MSIPESLFLQIKESNRIEDVIGSYVQLKKSGSSNYVGLCPFHSEKTPSFSVNIKRQFFYCFGCGVGGDVFTFIRLQENMEYGEAIRFLAERSGIKLPSNSHESPDKERRRIRIYEMNRAAARFYNNILANDKMGERGRLYLAQRELSPATVTKYGLGFAPGEGSVLSDFLLSQGYTAVELIQANLSRQRNNGTLYDVFRDRVMFPIIDKNKRVIAFGGRALESGVGIPKYLNTSDTPVFNKKSNLFSINFAKAAKGSEKRQMILAEGYMDVISINQAGFENVVASLGTSLTAEQARMISRYADEAVIAYDGDEAGQNAAVRAIDIFNEVGLPSRVLKVEGAKDPDEFIKKFGEVRFKLLLDKAPTWLGFLIEKAKAGLDTDDDNDKVEYLRRCCTALAKSNDPLEVNYFVNRLAGEYGFAAAAISEQVELVKTGMRGEEQRSKASGQTADWQKAVNFISEKAFSDPAARHNSGRYKAECGILVYLYRHPEDCAYVFERIAEDDISSPQLRNIYRAAKKVLTKESSDLMLLQSELETEEMGILVSLVEEYDRIEINKDILNEYINKVRSGTPKPALDLNAIAARKRGKN
ncbi:MAG: DNA primase [Oscillospiraceae bacterium]|nr:DNA primase [Oscillospiraceae bacterium]